MKTTRIILAALMVFFATQAHAIVYDFSSFGGGTYDARLLTFGGLVDITQSLGADNVLSAGDPFTITSLSMQATQYRDTATNNKLTIANSDVLTIVGTATGHLISVAPGDVPYVYDSIDLSLFYDNTLDVNPAVKIADAKVLQPPNGGNLNDNVLGNVSTGTYTITSPLADILPGVIFLSGKDVSTFSFPVIALTTGHLSFLDAGISGTNPVFISKGDIDGELKVTATPEPTTMLIMGSGLLGMFAARRRSKKNS
ncbi:PEP-CTERM sorting domain-containing protein [Fundidesulfovibrio terrae]|uniref:PEP-CTERM sorting domain-containing protein n=1 Tax=Fundidesulfovibrio terrae TaxID=2922866 RepID=UPI001FAFCFB2|nr:PEP-CTERM sorting domain-containing protein [Fundidesulfovibrio terrae]